MTIKFPSMPKIGLFNPVRGATSLMRAAGRKLQSSGSRHDLTKVRPEDPSATKGRTAGKAADQPKHPEAESCLRLLAHSKGEKANFYSQAFDEADKLTDLCFQGNASIGYNAVEESIFKDFAIWLTSYEASDVKKIDREAKEAKKVVFIGNADNLKMKSRTRMMDGIINECANRLRELKKKPASRSDVSTAPTAPAPAKPVPELLFRPTPVRDVPAYAPPVQPELQSQPEAVDGAARLLTSIERRDFAGFVRNLDEIGKLPPDEREKRLEAVKRAFSDTPPEPGDIEAMKRTMSAFFSNEANIKDHPVRMDQLWTTWRELQASPQLRQWTPAKPRNVAPASARPADDVTTERNPDLVASAKMIAAINKGDLDGFLGSLDEFHQLQRKSTDEILARYAQMKYAFENRPPRYEEIEAFKIEMAKLLKNPVLLGKHQAKIDEIKRAWLTVQTFFPEQRQETPTAIDAHDLEDSINRLDIPKFLRTLHAIGQVNDPKKRDEPYTAIEAADFGESFQRFGIERLNDLMKSVGERLTKDNDFDVHSRKRIDEICRTWLDLKTMNEALKASSRKAPLKEDLMLAKEVLAGLMPPTARP